MIITDRFNRVWEIVKMGRRWVATDGKTFIPSADLQKLKQEIAA